MNLLFRLFIFLGSLVVVVLFAALIAPYFIDWDEFTAEFEAQASRVVGQEVKVGGKTNLRLLPLPYLSFEDLQVGTNADGSPLMTVDQFSFNAELLPFLSGQVRIVEMSMQRPQVNLQVSEDGTIAWTNPKESLVNPEQVNIEKLNIENGSILVSGLVGNRSLQVENIQGGLSAQSILGPWRISADADVEGIASQIKIATGTFQQDGSMRLKMDLNRKDQPYNLLLDGPVKLQNDALSWDGMFKVSKFVKSQIEEMDKPVEPLPVSSSGTFMAQPDEISISEYRLDIGSPDDPYTITGQGSISLGEEIYFRMQADGRQIDIDQLEGAVENAEKRRLEHRLAVLHDVLKRVPVPTAKGEIDIILPAIVAGDTYIRDIKSLISPTGSGWVIHNLQATLPGNTAFEANGRLGLKNGFGFSGKTLLASRQPSGFADWVSGNVDETFRRLRSLGLASDIVITKRQVTLENVELRLDDALLQGRLQRVSAENGKPALIAEFKGNRVNVDDLSAIYSLTQNPNQTQPPHDLTFKVTAETFEAMINKRPFVAKGMDAHVQIRDGTLSVNRLNAQDLLGAKIETSGRIENILSRPNGNMKLNVSAENAVRLLEFSKQFLGQNSFLDHLKSDPDLTNDTQLEIELDTTEIRQGAKGRMLVNGVAGETAVALQIGYDGDLSELTALPLTFDGQFSNPSPSVFMQQLGLKPASLGQANKIPGPLKLDFSLEGIAKSGFDGRFNLSGKDALLAGTGKVVTQNWNDYDADLAVTLGAKDIAPYIVLADIPVPGFSADQAIPISTSFKLVKVASDFKLDELKGQVSGNRFSGNLFLQQEQVARPRLTGSLNLDKVSLSAIGEAVFGRTTTLGTSLGLGDVIELDENSIFGEPHFAGLDATLSIKSNGLDLTKYLEGKNASFQLAMIDGAIDLNALSFEVLNGNVAGGINLKNTNGDVLLNANYSVLGMDAEAFTRAAGMEDFITGKTVINGSIEATGQSLASLISNLSGNGFIAIKKGKINGVNVDALDAILNATAVDNYEITSEKITTLFNNNTFTSGFDLKEFDAPFSINRGKLRARNVTYSVSDTDFKSDLEYDLQTENLNANTQVEFTPVHREQISGAAPEAVITWNGPLQSLERSVNIDRLEGYLSLRAFEASQRRLETLEAQVIEKQRLRGEIAYAFAREQFVERKRLEAIRLEEERKLREAEEAKRLEEERLRLEAEEAKRLEEERLRLEVEAAEAERLRKIEEAEKHEEEARLSRLRAEAEEAEALKQTQEETVPTVKNNIFESIENFLNTN